METWEDEVAEWVCEHCVTLVTICGVFLVAWLAVMVMLP